MSRVRDGAGNSKANAMAIPNIPRMTDDKSKLKYMTDYEKYEPELRKHHLGGPDVTNTVSLKDVPADFNREIPSISQPTAAEKEYERAIQLRNSQRKKKNRFRPQSTSPSRKPAAATSPATSSATPFRPRLGSTSTAAGDVIAAEGAESVTATGTESAAGDARSGTVPGPSTSRSARTSLCLPAVKGPAATAAAARDKDHHKDKAHATIISPEQSQSQPQLTKGQKSKASTQAQSKQPQQEQQQQQQPHPPPKQDVSVLSEPSATRQSSRSSPRRRSSPRIPEKEVAINAAEVEQALRANAPRSLQQQPQREASETPDVNASADMLRVLVAPPAEYSDSFQLDTQHFDLKWLREKRPQPVRMTTIQTLQVGANGYLPTINSPRSILTMLRNGVKLGDLRPRKVTDVNDGVNLKDANVREAVYKFRTERETARRDNLYALLLDDYLALCSKVPLNELVQAYHTPKEPQALVETPSSVALRRERLARVFETNKVRMLKQVELMKDVHERKLIAEERQDLAEAEAADAIARKAEEDAQMRASHQARLEEQKRRNAEMDEAYRQRMAERLQKVEERNTERIAARERLFKSRQEQRAAIAEERRLRFERKEEAHRQLAEQAEERRLERLAHINAMMQERREREVEERKELAIRHENAAVAREEARRRAEQAQLSTREQARERQKQVEVRLEAFQQKRVEEQMQRAAEDVEKQLRRQKAHEQAIQSREEFTARTEQKRLAHEATFSEMQHRRTLESTIRVEHDREQSAIKQYAVKQQQRQAEYRKLKTIAELIEKRKAADFVTKQREVILDEALRNREMLMSEREALKKELHAASF